MKTKPQTGSVFSLFVLFLVAFSFSDPGFSWGRDNKPRRVAQGAIEKVPDDKKGAQTESPGGGAEVETVSRIDIRGNRRVETELIRINVSSKTGVPLSPETVREDIKRIYKLGYFENVSAEIERTPEGLILIYSVKEKPVVVDLRVRGNKEIKSADILDALEVKEGRIIELEKVKRDVQAIQKLYSGKGYYGTEVDYSIEPKGEGTVSVTYDIREGKEAYIKEVRFVGNKAIKSKEIKKVVYSKPKYIFSFATKRGLFKKEEVENDTDRIRVLYLDKGYLDVNVSKPEVEYVEKKKGFVITFRIEEGKQYRVGDIKFGGDLIASEDELTRLLKLKKGKVFSRADLAGDISKLTTFYGDKGYAFANIEPRFRPDKENLTVDIDFNIEKGSQVYIRHIDIVGNTRTRDKVIRREIPIGEQELFSSSKIQAIKPRVYRLGFFEENIEVGTERVQDRGDQLDVRVKVKEKPTGFFSVAGGFSSVETIIFAGQIQESNLFGYGKTLSLSAQIGGVTRLFFLNYQDPAFFDTDWTFDTVVFNTSREFRDFDRKSYGGTLTFGRGLFSNLGGRVTYRYEHEDIENVSGDAKLLIKEGARTISSIGLGLIWDSRDNLIDPSKGNITRSFIEFAGPFGGDTDFIKYTLTSRFFYPLWFNTVFSVFGEYGIIDLRNVGDDLVVGERFFLGGPNSLRGFEFRRVGPRVPTADGDFVIIGGTQELVLTAEYIVPLLPQAGLKGVLFFDMGNAFNDNEDLSLDPRDLRRDVGFGIRWVSPLGPLRLEVGFPIGKRLPGEDPYEIQFTIGTLF
ncbi:MAG TPA: outer membrane protein assembly factor BamA [Thermodesulfobacteriota bacterium]|jgi:outer membrane protein insertion porin family|nr:outer membrane protein assembly factor BamA [Thermodesulfobacteriota bacterium]